MNALIIALRKSLLQDTSKPLVKSKVQSATVRLSEIRSGSNFFFHIAGDEAESVIGESMRIFTAENGTNGAPCDSKTGKIVAALFNDGSGKSWYRARILEKKPGHAKVLFIDHGNVATVPIATHLRPLENALGVDRIPPVAKEAILAAVKTRGLDDDDGLDAARFLQSAAWGKDVSAKIFCENEGKLVVALNDPGSSTTINEQMVYEGLARVSKPRDIEALSAKMLNSESLSTLFEELKVAENSARKAHSGMWRYGDIGDEDDEEEY